MRERISAMWLIQLFIGIFFTASALIFLTGSNSAASEIARGIGKMFGKNNTWGFIFAIIQLISGVLLLFNLFVTTQPKLMFFASLVIFILWAINIFSIYFINGFVQPNFMVWISSLSLQLVVLSGLWGVMMGTRE